VGSIVVARPPGHAHGWDDDLVVVDGGATRSQSVANALAAVETELVAIHDAARPLVTPELIDGVTATLLADPEAGGAIAAAPVTDTIKRAMADGGGSASRSQDSGGYSDQKAAIPVIGKTIDRAGLWAAQTPQVFRVETLRRALQADPGRVEAATDEAMLVERAGGRVLLHPSPAENLKVTTPRDLRLAELLLA